MPGLLPVCHGRGAAWVGPRGNAAAPPRFRGCPAAMAPAIASPGYGFCASGLR